MPAAGRRQLKEAQAALQAAGVVVETELVAGEPQQVLPELVRHHASALLVMGPSGTLLRLSNVPVLIIR